MGHTLTDYPGDCARLHGHNYRFLVEIGYSPDPNTGMVVDFADLKRLVDPIVDDLDHHFMIWSEDPRADALQALDVSSVIISDTNPTAENIGTLLGRQINSSLRFRGKAAQIKRIKEDLPNLTLHSTTLWETEKSYATHVYG